MVAQAAVRSEKTKKARPAPRLVSLEAYLRSEEKALHKHEFYNGKVIKMPGGTFKHNTLAAKAVTLMNLFIEEKDLGFHVCNSDMKIRIDAENHVVYPDAVVICEKPEFFEGRKDIITNPLLIVEVSSKSTKKYDREDKFDAYRSIPSFREYVLVSQDRLFVSVYTKQTDGSWLLFDYDGIDSTAILRALGGCPMELRRLYRGLDF